MRSRALYRMRMLTVLTCLVVGGTTWHGRADENDTRVAYFEKSLEELMSTKVFIGSVTGTRLSAAPSSITTITRREIELTPARNLADLIEIYVPGALWLNHLSPKIGMRGLIIDRNFRLLLLVNGRNINQEGTQGATREIQLWDLNDVERIEVIRGPGSVTYGPGAIAGVINVITRTAAEASGGEIGATVVSGYDSMGGFSSYGYVGDDYDVYLYGSVRDTGGQDNPDIFRIDGVTGEAGYLSSSSKPIDYKGDNLGDPQVKLHADIHFLDEWRWWARFTRSGTATDGITSQASRIVAGGREVPKRMAGQEGFVTALQNDHRFSESFSVESVLSYNWEHYTDFLVVVPEKRFDEDFFQGNPSGNAIYDFDAEELFFSTMGHLNAGEEYRFALGYAFAYDTYGPGDQDVTYFNMKSFTTDDGRSMQGLVNDGFKTAMHSLIGEATLGFHPLATVMLSSRLDKNELSDYLYSPRIALISELDDGRVIRVLWQRSVRMATAEEMFKQNKNGGTSDEETLTGYEIAYGCLPNPNVSLSAAVFYNELEALGWSLATQQTEPVGELELAGIEAEALYRTPKLVLGANHSFIKQLDWDNGPGISVQGVSAADYDVNGLTDEGNDLSNWANHMTKLFATATVRDDLTLHGDVVIFWKWEGYEDYVRMYERKYENEGGDASWSALQQKLDDKDYAGTDIRLNLSLQWKPPVKSDLTVRVYGHNLLEARRYGLSAGVSKDYPERIAWVREPRTLGVTASLKF